MQPVGDVERLTKASTRASRDGNRSRLRTTKTTTSPPNRGLRHTVTEARDVIDASSSSEQSETSNRGCETELRLTRTGTALAGTGQRHPPLHRSIPKDEDLRAAGRVRRHERSPHPLPARQSPRSSSFPPPIAISHLPLPTSHTSPSPSGSTRVRFPHLQSRANLNIAMARSKRRAEPEVDKKRKK